MLEICFVLALNSSFSSFFMAQTISHTALHTASHTSPEGASALAVVILAAGKGTRMNNPNKAKVMFELSGVPMIDYVVKQALALSPRHIVTVVGFQKQSVVEHLSAAFSEQVQSGTLVFAHQDQQLGTGHAVQQAESALRDFHGSVLILSGDVPLLQDSTLRAFAAAHASSGAAATVLSVLLPDATGYGRIVRNTSDNKSRNGAFERIVEHKDASEAEREIREINSGIYLVDAQKLFAALRNVSNANAQGEFYLTDIIGILRAQGADSADGTENLASIVVAWQTNAFHEVQGINTIAQLAEAQATLEASLQAA
jgi:UDP-N-acetylglucosamine diphosphorylase/glucosamine-1-phosphate N-acetyltransferase